ncbi:MAG TPA: hypothetical protein VMF06_10300 [Candidatus Limnocylindria bacterium]|nr:hypothetical protein [Candidatus Limnocylindria bacterium]
MNVGHVWVGCASIPVTGMNPGLLAWERVQSGVALRLPPLSMTLRVVLTEVEFRALREVFDGDRSRCRWWVGVVGHDDMTV